MKARYVALSTWRIRSTLPRPSNTHKRPDITHPRSGSILRHLNALFQDLGELTLVPKGTQSGQRNPKSLRLSRVIYPFIYVNSFSYLIMLLLEITTSLVKFCLMQQRRSSYYP